MKIRLSLLLSLLLVSCGPKVNNSIEGFWIISVDDGAVDGHVEFVNGKAIVYEVDHGSSITAYEIIDENRYKLNTLGDFEGGLITVDYELGSGDFQKFGSTGEKTTLTRPPNISNDDLIGVWKDVYVDSDGRIDKSYITEIKNDYLIVDTLLIDHDKKVFTRSIEEQKYSLRNGFIFVTDPETSYATTRYIVSFDANSITYYDSDSEIGRTDKRIDKFAQSSVPQGYKKLSADDYRDLFESDLGNNNSIEGYWMASEGNGEIDGHIEFVNGKVLIKEGGVSGDSHFATYEMIDDTRYKVTGTEGMDEYNFLITLYPELDKALMQSYGSDDEIMELVRSPDISNDDLLGVWKDVYVDSDGRVEESYIVEIKNDYQIVDTLLIDHDKKTFTRSIEEQKYVLRNGFIFVTDPETSYPTHLYIVSFDANSITYYDSEGEIGWTDKRIEKFAQSSIPIGYKRVSEDGSRVSEDRLTTDVKVTSAIASVIAAKTAAINYYQRYDNFPLDSETATTGVLNYKEDPTSPVAYTPDVGNVDFGDILVYQSQLLEQEKTPVGRSTDSLVHAIGCVTVGEGLIGGATYGGTSTTMRFKSAGYRANRIVYYFMPNLTTQEAAALAKKVNGPFESDAVADTDFINASIAGSGIDDIGGLIGANAWFAPGDSDGEYHAYLYVSHQ